MARQTRAPEVPDTDAAHPRHTQRLIGQDAPLQIVSRAIRAGRPPQAWLLCGPPGVGKATLAYRIARYLLAFGASGQGPADLSVPPQHPAAAQVAAGSHPGLLLLSRAVNPDTGKPMTVLSVGEVRRLISFFGMTAGAGGWRVVIVDTADDMNDAAANALLKLLEEPPPRAMLLLLSNTPGKLLPTIRSRCQRLNLRPLSDEGLAKELAALRPDIATTDRAALLRLADGSIGAALQLAAGDGLALAQEAERLIGNAIRPDVPALLSLAERLGRMTDGLETLGDFLIEALAARIRVRAAQAQPHLDRWVEAHEALRRSFTRTNALHMEPKQTILGAARTLRATAARAGTV